MTDITVSWADGRQMALVLDFPEGWTWDDVYRVDSVVSEFAAGVNHPLDLIYLIDSQKSLPKNYFRHMRTLADRYPENIGLVIWTGGSRLSVEMIRSVARSYPDLARRYAFAEDLAEALRYPGP